MHSHDVHSTRLPGHLFPVFYFMHVRGLLICFLIQHCTFSFSIKFLPSLKDPFPNHRMCICNSFVLPCESLSTVGGSWHVVTMSVDRRSKGLWEMWVQLCNFKPLKDLHSDMLSFSGIMCNFS